MCRDSAPGIGLLENSRSPAVGFASKGFKGASLEGDQEADMGSDVSSAVAAEKGTLLEGDKEAGTSSEAGAEAGTERDAGRRFCDKGNESTSADADLTGGGGLPMSPEHEYGLLLHLAAECAATLSSAATSVEQDQDILSRLSKVAAPGLAGVNRETTGSVHVHQTGISSASPGNEVSAAASQECICDEEMSLASGSAPRDDEYSAAAEANVGAQHWRAACHMRMAVQYRLQRKLLLARVATDLEAQAALTGGP
jgi:hypothetical protein